MTLTPSHFLIIAASLIVGIPIGVYLGSRGDILTYDSLRLEPAEIESGQKAALVMSVTWLKTGCQLTIQQKVWSLDGAQIFSVDGPYVARMKDERRVLVDKPRDVVMPVLPPGQYEIGFSQVDGKCWPWENLIPVHNTPPKRFRFTVK